MKESRNIMVPWHASGPPVIGEVPKESTVMLRQASGRPGRDEDSDRTGCRIAFSLK